MKYLRVKNWEKLRHQEEGIPWVKLFTALLNPVKSTAYSDWPDQTKALLLHVWLMARVHNNRIPETWLTRERLNLQAKVNLKPLLTAELVWFEDEEGRRILDKTPENGLDASLEPNRQLTLEPTMLLLDSKASLEAFESLWKTYPVKDGKKASEKHFRASVRTRADFAAITQALQNYLRHLQLNADWKRPKNGSTFFNNWRDWADWKEPGYVEAEPEPEPASRHDRAWHLAYRSVPQFIEAHGDPDSSDVSREKFTKVFRSSFALDEGDADHWAKFLRVCAEEGIDPKPPRDPRITK